MAHLYNNCTFMGRLTKDPKVSKVKTKNGEMTKVFFTLAVQRPYDKNKTKQDTDFINFTAVGATADYISKWFTKGKVMVVGASYETYNTNKKDENGYDIIGHNFAVREVSFGLGDGHSSNNSSHDANSTPKSNKSNKPQPKDDDDDMFFADDDDMPF